MNSTNDVVNVTVIKFSGSTIFGPRDISRNLTIKGLKALFDKGRPKSLILGSQILEDTETFQGFPESVLLTVTYIDAMNADGVVDLEEEMSKYLVWERISEGYFADVFKATMHGQSSSDFVAIKRIAVRSPKGLSATTLREVTLLQQCDHPNIVPLREIVQSSSYLYAVMEHVDLNLRDYIKACGAVKNPTLLVSLVHQCFKGIDYCHGTAIMHRDIKPTNILLNVETMQVKLAGFGLARRFSLPFRQSTPQVATVWYRAPEIIMGMGTYGPAVDIWSMGTTFMEVARGAAIFAGDSEIGTLFEIFKKLGTPIEAEWPGLASLPGFKNSFPKWDGQGREERIAARVPHLCKDGLQVMMACWTYDPAKRPSARRCLAFDYFSDLEAHSDKQNTSLQETCTDTTCSPAQRSDYDSFDSLDITASFGSEDSIQETPGPKCHECWHTVCDEPCLRADRQHLAGKGCNDACSTMCTKHGHKTSTENRSLCISSDRAVLADRTNIQEPQGNADTLKSCYKVQGLQILPTSSVQGVTDDAPSSTIESRSDDLASSKVKGLADYESEIQVHLFRNERKFLPNADYMKSQVDINAKMRTILVDWLIEVHMKYRMRSETLYLAINIMDRYLAQIPIMRRRLQLVGLVALAIAAKFEEIDPPQTSDYIYITADNYPEEDILQMERHMLATLSFHISVPTAAHFVDLLHKFQVLGFDRTQHALVEHILNLGLLDIRMLQHTPSHVVCAALSLSNRILKRNIVWAAIPEHECLPSGAVESWTVVEETAWYPDWYSNNDGGSLQPGTGFMITEKRTWNGLIFGFLEQPIRGWVPLGSGWTTLETFSPKGCACIEHLRQLLKADQEGNGGQFKACRKVFENKIGRQLQAWPLA